MNKKRLIVFDLVKIIMAFLVVNLHVESFVTRSPFSPLYFLGWYAVPLFVTITFYFSGKNYLSKSFEWGEFLARLSRFAIPFVFWSIIGFIIHPELITLKYFFRQVLTGTAVDPPLYYLSTIMIVSVLIYLVRKVIIRGYFLLITILLLLVIETTGLEQAIASGIPIQIQLACIRIFEFSKYALLGIGLSVFKERITSYHHKYIFLLASIFTTFAHNYYLWKFQIGNLSYGGVTQFLAITLVMITIIMYSQISFSDLINKQINQIGALSLGVYCLHTFFLERISGSSPHLILSIWVFTLSLLVSIIIRNVWAGRLKAVVS